MSHPTVPINLYLRQAPRNLLVQPSIRNSLLALVFLEYKELPKLATAVNASSPDEAAAPLSCT